MQPLQGVISPLGSPLSPGAGSGGRQTHFTCQACSEARLDTHTGCAPCNELWDPKEGNRPPKRVWAACCPEKAWMYSFPLCPAVRGAYCLQDGSFLVHLGSARPFLLKARLIQQSP